MCARLKIETFSYCIGHPKKLIFNAHFDQGQRYLEDKKTAPPKNLWEYRRLTPEQSISPHSDGLRRPFRFGKISAGMIKNGEA
jgi:hypothetical protein